MSYKGSGGGDNHERLGLARLSPTRINTPHMGEIVRAVCVYVCARLCFVLLAYSPGLTRFFFFLSAGSSGRLGLMRAVLPMAA